MERRQGSFETPTVLELAAGATLPPEKDASSLVQPPPGFRRLDSSGVNAPRLTHYMFRFPAKFHPPVVHSLIREYTTSGQTLLDPFCGSGTLLLAATVEGLHAIGSDVDPVAVFVAKVKTHRFRPGTSSYLLGSASSSSSAKLARTDDEYHERCFTDITPSEYEATLSDDRLMDTSYPESPTLVSTIRSGGSSAHTEQHRPRQCP